MIALFSAGECFNSDPWRVLEKNATSLPLWFKAAGKAISEASVFNSNGWDSSMTTTTNFFISDSSDLNSLLASSVSENDWFHKRTNFTWEFRDLVSWGIATSLNGFRLSVSREISPYSITKPIFFYFIVEKVHLSLLHVKLLSLEDLQNVSRHLLCFSYSFPHTCTLSKYEKMSESSSF